jgi:L-fuconolactonase
MLDAHQHLWNFDETRPVSAVGEFLRSIVEPQLAQAGVDGTILVQAADSLNHSRSLFDIAYDWPVVKAVVAWIPLTDAALAERAIDEFSQHDLFVGVRHLMHLESNPDWLIQDAVFQCLALLEQRGLTFDTVPMTLRQLEQVSIVAQRFPRLRIAIDHLAKPPAAERGWQPWASLLAAAADHPNVYTKLSGLTLALAPGPVSTAAIQRYVDFALGCFGPDRVMLGGDWPITVLNLTYAETWSAVRTAVRGLNAAQQADVDGRTAMRFYAPATRGIGRRVRRADELSCTESVRYCDQ